MKKRKTMGREAKKMEQTNNEGCFKIQTKAYPITWWKIH